MGFLSKIVFSRLGGMRMLFVPAWRGDLRRRLKAQFTVAKPSLPCRHVGWLQGCYAMALIRGRFTKRVESK